SLVSFLGAASCSLAELASPTLATLVAVELVVAVAGAAWGSDLAGSDLIASGLAGSDLATSVSVASGFTGAVTAAFASLASVDASALAAGAGASLGSGLVSCLASSTVAALLSSAGVGADGDAWFAEAGAGSFVTTVSAGWVSLVAIPAGAG